MPRGAFPSPRPPMRKRRTWCASPTTASATFPQGGPLMPGSTTADLTVYDAAKKVDGLSQTVEVDRFQSDGKQLQGITLYAVTQQVAAAAHAGQRQGHLRDRSARRRGAGIRAGQGSRRTAHRHRSHARRAEESLPVELSAAARRDAVPGRLSHALQRRGQLLAQAAAARCSTSS